MIASLLAHHLTFSQTECTPVYTTGILHIRRTRTTARTPRKIQTIAHITENMEHGVSVLQTTRRRRPPLLHRLLQRHAVELFHRNHRRTRHLVESIRPRRHHHGHDCMGPHGILLHDHDMACGDGRDSGVFGHVLYHSDVPCALVSYQNVPDRSGRRAPVGSPHRRATSFGTQIVHVQSVPNLQTTFVASLPHLQSLYQSDGSSLPVDEQLHWSGEFETFCSVSSVYMDLCGDVSAHLWMELLFLCGRSVCVYRRVDAVGACHDRLVGRGFFVYEQHVDECGVRHFDGHWDN